MKIYTKTGDNGSTGLYDGTRLPKSDMIFDALGVLDELSCHIGMLLALEEVPQTETTLGDCIDNLRTIQRNLLDIGSNIATQNENKRKRLNLNLDVSHLENTIDLMDKSLPKLTVFILPGQFPNEVQAHLCRAVCRRAERHVWKLSQNEYYIHPDIMKYLNRLSDYFFTLARFILHDLDIPEERR